MEKDIYDKIENMESDDKKIAIKNSKMKEHDRNPRTCWEYQHIKKMVT